MYQFSQNELERLLTRLKRIRQKIGESISEIEHLIQLQDKPRLDYNPDAYLEKIAREDFMSEKNEKENCNEIF